MAVLKPVHWSTTVIGDCGVVVAAAQAGMALLKVTVRWAQSAQLEGFMGMILATRILMFGLLARIWFTIVVNALRIVAGAMLLHTSLVPKCMSTTSGRVAASQPVSRPWFATFVAR